MKVATPHWPPEGDSSSAGMIVSAAATKKACSVAVSVSSGSGSAAAAATAAGACACAGAVGVSPAATAVPAPNRKLRRAIGLLSSGIFFSVDFLSPVLVSVMAASRARRDDFFGERGGFVLFVRTRLIQFLGKRERPDAAPL